MGMEFSSVSREQLINKIFEILWSSYSMCFKLHLHSILKLPVSPSKSHIGIMLWIQMLQFNLIFAITKFFYLSHLAQIKGVELSEDSLWSSSRDWLFIFFSFNFTCVTLGVVTDSRSWFKWKGRLFSITVWQGGGGGQKQKSCHQCCGFLRKANGSN